MPTSSRRLPLYVALAALVLYAGTMGGGLTLYGLPLVSKLAGWDATPLAGQPLLWLLTLPLQVLPAAWLPLSLKLFAALLAAAMLGLLTRTVQMLPWDHPWDNVSRLGCTLPAMMASAICGLEFSYWQEATTTCGDLLDLLLLAAALWLLLEYNVRRQARWLHAAALVWGLGMAESWVLWPAFPLFVAAVIRLERYRFFDGKLILRLTGLGAAGFSIYVLAPIAHGLLPHSPWTLRDAWAATWQQTWHALVLPYKIWHANRFAALAVAICFLVPTLPLLVRMRDEGTQNKSGVDKFQLWLYRGLRLSLLLACCWLAFDPGAGARQMLHPLGIRLPLLTFDYLNALGAAYLVGNLLLISQLVVRDEYRRSRDKNEWRRFAVPVITAGIALVVAGLLFRNAPAIWRLNYHPLEEFGAQAVQSLPAGGGVVLSDFPEKLRVFQAALARAHGTAEWLPVETHALPTVEYRAGLERRRPAGWLTDETRHELTAIETMRLLEQVARSHRLFYLHPSFGQYFEAFYLEPVGTIYEMKLRGKNPLEVPPLPDPALETNERYWTRLWDQQLAALVPPPSRHQAGVLERKLARFSFTAAPRNQDLVLREWYSIPLEAWGVTLQKQGRWREAQTRFDQALLLNTNNLSARISLACNTNLQAGNPQGLGAVRKVADELGDPDRINQLMNLNGPFDEPTVCYVLGSVYLDHGLLVQAAEQMERVRMLTATALAPERGLAEIYNRLQMPERSLLMVRQVREELRKMPVNTNSPADLDTLDLELALEECNAWRLQTNLVNARDALQAVVRRHPGNAQIAQRVVTAFLEFNDLTAAEPLVDERLASAPEDVTSLNAKAIILIKAGRASAALPFLDHALSLTNDPTLRLNRAVARIDNLDYGPAKSDLAELEKSGYVSGNLDYELALMAEHDRDTNSAQHYFQLCVSNSLAGTPLWQEANAQLRKLAPAVK